MRYETTHVMDTAIGLTVTVYEAKRIVESIDEMEDAHWSLLDLRKTLVEGLTRAAERMQEHGAYIQAEVKGYEQ